jgi:uncharacterized BrkB/YihY/UPF0761 family membrane protein
LIERTNEVVKSAIDALRSNPLLLVVVLLNVLFIVSGLVYLRAEQRQMDAMIKACVERSK